MARINVQRLEKHAFTMLFLIIGTMQFLPIGAKNIGCQRSSS